MNQENQVCTLGASERTLKEDNDLITFKEEKMVSD
jgi:hypothetical protein